MKAGAARADSPIDMNVLRLATAGIVAVLGLALGTASAVAFLAGGYFWFACLYGLAAIGLLTVARRLRPRRRDRYVFARRRGNGYLTVRPVGSAR